MADIDYANLTAGNDVSTWANQQAQAAYYNALASGQSASQALQQAQFAWKQKMDEAGQTGMWNGQYNMPSQQNFATQFGQWYGPGGAPAVGTQTLAAQQQAANIAGNWSQMFGQYYAPGTTPGQGAQTLGALGQAQQNAATVAGLTGYYNAPVQQQQYIPARVNQLVGMGYDQARAQSTAQSEWDQGFAQTGQVAGGMPQGIGGNQQTLAGQQQQWSQGFQQQGFQAQQAQLAQQNAQQYLQLLSSLRGPADWAKYQQVLGSTPGGMRDLYAAAMGQYVPGGGATTGYQPQAANLNTMQQQIAGQPADQMQYAGGTPGWAGGGAAQRQQQMQQGGNQQVWGSGIGIGAQQATPDQQAQAAGNGTNMYGGQQQQYNLPAPNQISAQAWNNFTPSQQQLMLGNYEAAGWDKNDVMALHNQSLPKYAQNNPTAGTFQLR